MSTKESQYAGFDEWGLKYAKDNWGWDEYDTEEDFQEADSYKEMKAAWMAASYRMENIKDRAYTISASQKDRSILLLKTRLEVRKEVHQDDYKRSAILVAGLKRIEKLGGRAGKIATEALNEALKNWKSL